MVNIPVFIGSLTCFNMFQPSFWWWISQGSQSAHGPQLPSQGLEQLTMHHSCLSRCARKSQWLNHIVWVKNLKGLLDIARYWNHQPLRIRRILTSSDVFWHIQTDKIHGITSQPNPDSKPEDESGRSTQKDSNNYYRRLKTQGHGLTFSSSCCLLTHSKP